MSDNFILSGPPCSNRLPEDKAIGWLIYEHLKNEDDGPSVIVDSFSGESYSGKQLYHLVFTLAASLSRTRSLQRGDVVTILSPNTHRSVSVFLASLVLGLTVNWLNYEFKADELKPFILACKPQLIFCTSHSVPNLQELFEMPGMSTIPCVYLDVHDGPVEAPVDSYEALNQVDWRATVAFDPPTDIDVNDVALIMTSSGTSGLPKGVMLTHKNLLMTMNYMGNPDVLGLDMNHVTLGYLPMFHLFGCSLVLASVLFRTKVVLMERFAPDAFLKLIKEHRVTTLFAVPLILSFLLDHPSVRSIDLVSVVDLISTAAPLSRELMERAQRKLPIRYIRQAYGMTEICGAVTCLPRDDLNLASVGKVIQGFQLKVCDIESGATLCFCQRGEIRIKGDSVMKGYLEDEEATKEAFDEEGFLKTGDVGYFDNLGYVYVVDRIKELIKYKSFQVAPAEIEQVLSNHPSIEDAGVIGIRDAIGGEVPMAFVVKKPDADVTEKDVQKYIAEKMSNHNHLRGGVKFVKTIPKKASGKILRRELRKLVPPCFLN